MTGTRTTGNHGGKGGKGWKQEEKQNDPENLYNPELNTTNILNKTTSPIGGVICSLEKSPNIRPKSPTAV